MDFLTRAQRSCQMGLVRARDTKPEMAVRRMVHALGYRFRLHGSSLPGRPDMVFAGRRKVLFIHGCFWHRHARCVKATTPKTNAGYWKAKFLANRRRDRQVKRRLLALGWGVVVVWECELKEPVTLTQRLVRELEVRI